jgi:hypothetical protein
MLNFPSVAAAGSEQFSSSSVTELAALFAGKAGKVGFLSNFPYLPAALSCQGKKQVRVGQRPLRLRVRR